MARKQYRLDAPTSNPNSAEHRRQIAMRANAALSKDGGNSMNVPLVLQSVPKADLSGVIPPDSPYYPPLWVGGGLWVPDAGPDPVAPPSPRNGRIAYSNGLVWVVVPGTGDYQPAGDYQPHNANLDALALITYSADMKLFLDADTYADMRKQLGVWTSVLKDQTETKTTLTPGPDAKLVFPVAASKTYTWRGVISYTTNIANDFKYNFTGPAIGAGSVRYGHSAVGVGVAAPIVGVAVSNGSNLSVTSTTGTGEFLMGVYGTLINGVNGGSMQFNWSQDTGTATSMAVNAGSWIEFKEL